MLSFSSCLSFNTKIIFNIPVPHGKHGLMHKLNTFHVIARSYMTIFDLDESVLYFLFSMSMAEN